MILFNVTMETTAIAFISLLVEYISNLGKKQEIDEQKWL